MAKKEEAKKQSATAPKPGIMGTAVATVKQAMGVIIAPPDQVPEHLKAAMASNRGSENVQSDDLVIPRLEIVQPLSPQIEEGHAKYIPGAKQGDLYNSASNMVYGKEVYVVDVSYEKLFLVWVDRDKGGGFRGQFKDMADAQRRANEEGGEAKGLKVLDTPTHLCLIIDPNTGKADEIMIAMPRTKAKISRAWNSMIRMSGGDRFSRVYKVTTNKETNAKGTYFNFAVSAAGFPQPATYKQAEALYLQVQSGKGRTLDTRDFDTQDPAGSDEM